MPISTKDRYASQKKYKQALPEYDKAIKLDPEYHLAYYNRAMAYRRTGNNAKAMEDYTKCISLNPEYAAAYESIKCI
ncbi:MAG: tetratricopeptide repeat protein [Bacteroidetes bacterium]|nr:tetratricopeptide repeat protein [Bacteroidota bacterium]